MKEKTVKTVADLFNLTVEEDCSSICITDFLDVSGEPYTLLLTGGDIIEYNATVGICEGTGTLLPTIEPDTPSGDICFTPDDLGGTTFTSGVYFVEVDATYVDPDTEETKTITQRKCILVDCTLACKIVDFIADETEACQDCPGSRFTKALIYNYKALQYHISCGDCCGACKFYDMVLIILDDTCIDCE